MPKASKTGSFRKTAAADAAARKIKKTSSHGERHEDVTAEESQQRLASTATIPATSTANSTTQSPEVAITVGGGGNSGSGNEEEMTAEIPLSRGQRKRLAKQKQYQRKQDMIMSSLKLKYDDDQKKRIDGLDAMKEALMATVRRGVASSTTPTTSKGSFTRNDEKEQSNNDETSLHGQQAVNVLATTKPNLLKNQKSQKLLVQKEAAQLELVVQHPTFQANPFATIREHLKNVLAPDAILQKQQEAQRSKQQKQAASASPKKKMVASQRSLFPKKRKAHRARPTRSKRSK